MFLTDRFHQPQQAQVPMASATHLTRVLPSFNPYGEGKFWVMFNRATLPYSPA
ncbi:hypothetical protein DB31_8755 [Hyalangium minutum]|uniref:Uncharacterized protein n=1 Tax=Hyalangium minutum TaxID=394096 RepID=A0A085WI89_9BACT|nr:hypothetical protein DB31_8668 [Hyalangium minutum]KFE67402.1 hypothetical protein DB31_8755 [Hyalangium minutum]